MMAMVRKGGFEPPRLSAPPPQDGVSASSTTSAQGRNFLRRGCLNYSKQRFRRIPDRRTRIVKRRQFSVVGYFELGPFFQLPFIKVAHYPIFCGSQSVWLPQKRGAQICQRSSWRKLAKIVNLKLLLYLLHTRHHAFKPLLAEELMLSLLEVLPQRVIFIARNDLVQRRKENSILSCFMRRIHPDKLMQGGCELLFITTRFETTSG